MKPALALRLSQGQAEDFFVMTRYEKINLEQKP